MREVLSLGAFVFMLLAGPCRVRAHAKARCRRNGPCAKQTGVLQYWAFECARMPFERFSSGAGRQR
jgi:hypothetical protein